MASPSYRRLLVIGLIAASVAIVGQPGIVRTPIMSIDLRVIRADRAMVGTVADFKETGKRDTRLVTFDVGEALKGITSRQLTGPVNVSARDLTRWKKQKHRILVADVPGETSMEIIDLNEPGFAAVSSELKILRDPPSVIAAAREALALHPTNTSIRSFNVPAPQTEAFKVVQNQHIFPNVYWNGEIKVPVDINLEQRALAWARSRQVQERAAAARMLSFFKTEANETLLRTLLQDPGRTVKSEAQFNNAVEIGVYPVREAAFDVLTKDWKLSVAAPVVSDEIALHDTVESIIWQGTLTDEGLQNLADRSHRLKSLFLPHNAPLTDRQASLIGRITSLTSLTLRGPRPIDATLKHFGGLVNLQKLDIAFSRITDDGLKELAPLKNLRSITLTQTRISDDGLQILAGYPNMHSIDIALTQVTAKGISKAKSRRPDLEIASDTPLKNVHEYAYRGDIGQLRKQLRDDPAKIWANGQDFGGNTPLFYAVGQDRYDAVKLLLDFGASIDKPDAGRRTPLQWAAWHGYDKLAKLLLDKGADIRHRDENGDTALHLAARQQHIDVTKTLVARGADVVAKNLKGETALELLGARISR
jgi:hypothetical protein